MSYSTAEELQVTEGDLLELECDGHRPRRVNRVERVADNGDVLCILIPTPGCDCDWCADPKPGWFGRGLTCRRVAAEQQAALW